jgi:O-succinylbenzoic acid--CoA ligase
VAATGLDPCGDAFWRGCETALFTAPGDPAARSLAEALSQDLPREAPPGLVHFLTSGSSGRPKIVAFTRDALLTSARAVNAFLGVTSNDIWLRVLPVFHVGGFQVEARAWAARAICLRRDERWDPRATAELCTKGRVSHISLVPTQVYDLVQAGLPAPPSLRVVLVGGGELRPALHARARALGWPVRTSYGLTEAASTVAVQADAEENGTRLTVLPHWQVSADAEGILHLDGPALPAAVAAWSPDLGRHAWQSTAPPLRTADRVHLDGRTLVFLGRADRVVKRLGELVDLAQVERALADAALACQAYGKVRLRCEADPRAGHRLVLECLDPAVGTTVAACFNDAQPAFARIEDLRVVDDLRFSPLGKPVG